MPRSHVEMSHTPSHPDRPWQSWALLLGNTAYSLAEAHGDEPWTLVTAVRDTGAISATVTGADLDEVLAGEDGPVAEALRGLVAETTE